MLPEPVTVPGERIFEFVTAADDQSYGLAVAEIQESQPHWHDRTRECYTLLRGRVEVFVDGKPTTLERFGDRIVIPPGVPHWAKSCGVEPATIAVLSEPAWNPADHHLVEPATR